MKQLKGYYRKWAYCLPGYDVIVVMMCAFVTYSEGLVSEDGVVLLERSEMQALYANATLDCILKRRADIYPADGRLYCNSTWDGIMCWDFTLAGTIATQRCARYVNKFNVYENATRECGADGAWRFYPDRNRTWTDYGACMARDPEETIMEKHLPRIKLMYQIGFLLSIISLVLAIFIMIYFKKLHCARNTIHINLFLSFIVRAVCLIVKDSLFVDGIGFSYDLADSPASGVPTFNANGTAFGSDPVCFELTKDNHWQCKLFITFLWYSLCTNLMWIFVEALYLYLLIFVAVFSERNNVVRYIIFGWSAPLSFIIPWAMVRLHLENDYCWQMNKTMGYVWIIQGPIVIVVLANFFIFLATVWTLFTKLRASNTPEARRYRYRKLARSTLVLIPLFGVYYILLVWLPVGSTFGNNNFDLIYHYIHAFLDSYQGIAVSFLFCFLNGEVRTELRKKCVCETAGGFAHGKRSTWTTVSTYVSRARNSLHSTVEKSEVGAQYNGSAATAKHRNYTPPNTPPRDKHEGKVVIETKLVNAGEEEQRLMLSAKEESVL